MVSQGATSSICQEIFVMRTWADDDKDTHSSDGVPNYLNVHANVVDDASNVS